MYLRLHQHEWSYIFDYWAYGEAGKLLVGSGLFVGQSGVTYDHHFALRRGSDQFYWWDGDYRIEVFASIVGKPRPQKLLEIKFTFASEQAAQMAQILDMAAFFEWNAETQRYAGYVERRPKDSDTQGASS
jgi:hypothetical protein